MNYQEFKNVSGIYKIESKIDGKIYIGSAKQIRNRINKHQNNLLNNCHCSPHLQNAFNKYGIDNFNVVVLEFCKSDKKSLIEKEQFYFDLLTPFKSEIGYNSCEIAGSPEHRKLSEEHKEKIRNSHLGKTKSDVTKKRIGDAHRGKKMSAESIDTNRKWHTGIKQSEESVIKRAKQYSFIDSEGNIHVGTNLKRFCDKHNLHRPNMNLVLKGIRKSHHGFKKY